MNENEFEINITSQDSQQDLSLAELWRYRDLVVLMVRRDFVANYKQTILGPSWAIIQPIASTLITSIVFGNLAGMSPNGVPVFLFYMVGQIMWHFFQACLVSTTDTFLSFQGVMSKVYFPRFVAPIASASSHFISLLIQIALFTGFYIYFVWNGYPVSINWTLALIPIYIIHLAAIGLGTGAILSAMTTKYRDLKVLISYGVTFWMYLSPVVYDVSKVPERFKMLYLLNPVAPILRHIRYAVFTQGNVYWEFYGISIITTIVIVVIGYRIFNHVARNFIDTI